jgi:hypothetical protein
MNQVQEEEFFIRLSKDKENMMHHPDWKREIINGNHINGI